MGRPLASSVVGGVISGDSLGMLEEKNGEEAMGASRRPPGMGMGAEATGRGDGIAMGVEVVPLLNTLPVGDQRGSRGGEKRTFVAR
jgi:hypothetical protein